MSDQFRPVTAVMSLLIAGCHQLPPRASAIEVRDGWIRATAPGQVSGAAYATIINSGTQDDRLIGVSSPRATAAMLHGSSNAGGVMAMRMTGAVRVAPGATVTLAPLGTHIMLTGLTGPLKAGERLPLTLRFARAGERRIEAAVVPATAAGVAG